MLFRSLNQNSIRFIIMERATNNSKSTKIPVINLRKPTAQLQSKLSNNPGSKKLSRLPKPQYRQNSISQENVDLTVCVGRRVNVSGVKFGVLRYYGQTSFAPGMWCGVELDEPQGKNNGVIDGVSYFSCRKNHGIFVASSKIQLERDDDKTRSSLLTVKNLLGKKIASPNSKLKMLSLNPTLKFMPKVNLSKRFNETVLMSQQEDAKINTKIVEAVEKDSCINKTAVAPKNNVVDLINETVVIMQTEESKDNFETNFAEQMVDVRNKKVANAQKDYVADCQNNTDVIQRKDAAGCLNETVVISQNNDSVGGLNTNVTISQNDDAANFNTTVTLSLKDPVDCSAAVTATGAFSQKGDGMNPNSAIAIFQNDNMVNTTAAISRNDDAVDLNTTVTMSSKEGRINFNETVTILDKDVTDHLNKSYTVPSKGKAENRQNGTFTSSSEEIAEKDSELNATFNFSSNSPAVDNLNETFTKEQSMSFTLDSVENGGDNIIYSPQIKEIEQKFIPHNLSTIKENSTLKTSPEMDESLGILTPTQMPDFFIISNPNYRKSPSFKSITELPDEVTENLIEDDDGFLNFNENTILEHPVDSSTPSSSSATEKNLPDILKEPFPELNADESYFKLSGFIKSPENNSSNC